MKKPNVKRARASGSTEIRRALADILDIAIGTREEVTWIKARVARLVTYATNNGERIARLESRLRFNGDLVDQARNK
jgi:hypothetical protein